MILDPQIVQISQKQNGRTKYAILKTMYPPGGYHHNGFVMTHALGHMMYGYIYLLIYIYKYIYLLHVSLYMVFTTEGFFEVTIESWPERELFAKH